EEAELGRIELYGARLDEGSDEEVRHGDSDHRAVFRRGVGEIIDGVDAAGARQMLDRNGGVAGNVLAEIGRQQQRIGAEAAARFAADHDLKLFAAIEIALRQRRGAAREGRKGGQRQSGNLHGRLLPRGIMDATAKARGSAEINQLTALASTVRRPSLRARGPRRPWRQTGRRYGQTRPPTSGRSRRDR